MTDAQRTSQEMQTAAAVVAAERFGMPVIDGDRAVLIAALHTVINWLIDHPGIPCPQYIDLKFHPRAGLNPTAKDLLDIAQQVDGAVHASAATHWVEARIPLGEGAGGVDARYAAWGRDRQYVAE